MSWVQDHSGFNMVNLDTGAMVCLCPPEEGSEKWTVEALNESVGIDPVVIYEGNQQEARRTYIATCNRLMG